MPDAPFAAIEPFATRTLEVGAGHRLYLEEVGTPAGTPAVFLHGGPGGGLQTGQRRLFDPERFRVVLFDQRGAGRSTPKRGLEANTTQELVADMERIREALGIERWLVVGGSFGALLAVAYAEAHPDRVTGLVLRAVFLGGADEIDWAFRRGPETFYPDLWRRFVELLPEAERADPLAAYGARILDGDAKRQAAAAWAWHGFERTLSVLKPGSLALPDSLDPKSFRRKTPPASPILTWHYMRHDFFLAHGALLDGAGRLAGIPGIIVQGRYDLLCPPRTAEALARRWPAGELRLIEAAGHAAAEPGIQRGLLAAIDEIGRKVG